MEVRYLDVEDLLRITELEGIGPVRDVGLLDSAANRPRASAFGVDAYPALERKTAALLESVVRNHPLVDGNKRLGWLSAVAFLWVNGQRLTAPPDAAYDLVIGIAEGRIGIEETGRLLGEWSEPLA